MSRPDRSPKASTFTLDPAGEAKRMEAALTTLKRSSWDAQLAVLEMLADAQPTYVAGDPWHSAYFERRALALLGDPKGEGLTSRWSFLAFAPYREEPLLSLELSAAADLSVRAERAGVGFVIATGAALVSVPSKLRQWAIDQAGGAAMEGSADPSVRGGPFLDAYQVHDLTFVYLRTRHDVERAVAEGFVADLPTFGTVLDVGRLPEWAHVQGPSTWERPPK